MRDRSVWKWMHLLLLGQSEQVGVGFMSAKVSCKEEESDLLHNWKVKNIP